MRLILLLLALAAVGGCDRQKAEIQQGNESAEIPGVPTKGGDRSQKGKAAPDVDIVGPDGDEMRFADLKGPVLVNFWASWCAPCVKELPTLNALARRHDADGALAIVALSQDMGPQTSVEAFLAKLNVADLGAYQDPKMAAAGALNINVMPTSILYDADGKEVWRYVGDLDWSGAEAAKLLAEAGAPAKR